MTREDRLICPVPGCGKRVARLEVHFRQSHPDLNPDDYSITLGLLPAGPDPALSAAAEDDPPTELDPDPEPEDPPQPSAASAAPAVDFQAALAPMADMIRQLGAANAQLQAQLLQQQKEMAEFRQSVIAGLNSVPAIVDKSLTQRLDQVAAEYQQSLGMTPPEAQPNANPMAAAAGDPKMSLLTHLLPALVEKLFKPEPTRPAESEFGKLLELLRGADAIAEMRQAPYRNGFDDALKLLTTANRMGVSTEKIQSMSELKGAGGPPAA